MSTETTRDRAREVIAVMIEPQAFMHGIGILANPQTPVERSVYNWQQSVLAQADAILTALADAGIRLARPGEVVVDAGRFERLRSVAVTYLDSTPGGITYMLQPGDLDPNATQPCNDERCCFCGRCLTIEEIYWYTNQCNDCAGSVQYDDDDPIPAPNAGDGREG